MHSVRNADEYSVSGGVSGSQPQRKGAIVIRSDALCYVMLIVDDAGTIRVPTPVLPVATNARLIGWRCGADPVFVAVQSYLGIHLDIEDAVEMATEALVERGWFAGEEREPHYRV